MARKGPALLASVVGAIERACGERGVACRSEPIPYGQKLTLAQGAVEGVLAVYATGKVVANPRAKEHFADVLAAIETRAARPARGGKRSGASSAAALEFPCLGSDESGKGDYFGPLVAAAVVVADAREAELLAELGVRDSKELGSPAEARRIAGEIRAVVKGRFAEVVIEPEAYNRRFAELRAHGANSHTLLAELHGEAMAGAVLGLAPASAITDKFGAGKEIERERKRRGFAFRIRQETGGERWVAVAAASILARDRCLEWFAEAETRFGGRLPRGAFDPGILVAGRRLFASGGLEELGRYAKLHFRTTEKVTR